MPAAAPQPALTGIIPPLITPLSEPDQLDVAGLERLIERLIGGGVHGLFALGTTGEGPSLSHNLRHKLVEHVCDQVAGRVPVLVGVTDTSFEEAVELAQHAYAAGAKAVVAAAPYYLPLSQRELQSYIEQLLDAIPLPLVLYNMPSCTKTAFAPDTVQRLSRQEAVLGLKDSSGDLDYFTQVQHQVADRADFSLLVGPEELLAEVIARGGHGCVGGGANLFPRLYVMLYEAARHGDRATVSRLQQVVEQISQTIYRVTDDPSRIIRGLKCALHCLGICDDAASIPMDRFDPQQRETLQRHLQALLGQPGCDAQVVSV